MHEFFVGLAPQRGRPGKSAHVESYFYRLGFGNRRVEKVVDAETGEILIERDEPLTEHQGYGSAKTELKNNT